MGSHCRSQHWSWSHWIGSLSVVHVKNRSLEVGASELARDAFTFGRRPTQKPTFPDLARVAALRVASRCVAFALRLRCALQLCCVCIALHCVAVAHCVALFYVPAFLHLASCVLRSSRAPKRALAVWSFLPRRWVH